MGRFHILSQSAGEAVRVTIAEDAQPLSAAAVLREWADGTELCGAFADFIAGSPHEAVFWEMPPLNRARLVDEYECVLIGSPALARLPCNPAPFREHFTGEEVAVFPNLGADAWLVAPPPSPPDAQYTHLAAFCRIAPHSLIERFWQRVGETALARIETRPVWISTAGLGVGWLHARLDSRPKYYSHGPYRRWP